MKSPAQSAHNVKTRLTRLTLLPLAAAICLAVTARAPARQAQTPAPAAKPDQAAGTPPGHKTTRPIKKLPEIIVTAQKHAQNLQDVHVAMQVLDSQQLRQLNIQGFKDYVQYLPSVSYQEGGGSIAAGPGFAWIDMRGVASGGTRNYSGSSPSVAVYLDNEPITTIQGPVDLHMYDINRVEVLEGPQSTLFGASAEAGAIRIITNQPDPDNFAANYSVEANKVQFGDLGYTVEGMLNAPITRMPFGKDAALRIVAWKERDAGYMDNVAGSRTFPSSGITISNAPGCVPSDNNLPASKVQCIGHAQQNYNDVITQGARAALKIDLDDNWSVTPKLMGQQTLENGTPASDTVIGDYAVTHYYPEHVDDRWWQAALSVQGKIGRFDVDYNYSHMIRTQVEVNDYSDYAFWYDTLDGLGQTFLDNQGNLINPSYSPIDRDRYIDTTNELHVVSPSTDRLRIVAGIYNEGETADIFHNFYMNGLSDHLSITGWPGTLWLNNESRVDRSFGLYGQLSWDFIPNVLTGTVGGRYYRTSDRLYGFYGFSNGYAPGVGFGESGCITTTPFRNAPCLVYDKRTRDSGPLHLYTLTWHIAPDKLIYATRSEGFRPGGINRSASLAPYQPDFLVNDEVGWKTSWFGHRLTFNGDFFRDRWNDFQFTILGPNGLGEIMNSAAATIKGFETSIVWQATYNLSITGGAAYYDARLAENYCGFTNPAGVPVTDCPAGAIDPDTGAVMTGPQAPTGTRLPITPMLKGNLIARYEFSLGSDDAFWQVALVHVGERTSDLRLVERGLLGDLPAYNLVNVSAGIQPEDARWSINLFLSNLFNKRAALYNYTECSPDICAAHNVVPQYPDGQVYTGFAVPRTLGIRFTERFGSGT